MTVSTTASVKVYTGDNSTTAFSFPYLFYSNSHLKVYLDGVLKAITTHYTVTGAENPAGGTVTFLTAPGTGVEVVIQRIAPTTQETDLENFDGNPADVTEKQFDLLAMVDQQLTEQVARTILAPIGTTLTTNTISGDITATNKVLLISTAGPSAAAISAVDTSLDAIFTDLASGDIIQYNGTNWVNVDGPLALGAAHTVLQVNSAGTAQEYALLDVNNLKAGFINDATTGTIDTADYVLFADNNDSNATKKDTVANLLALASVTGVFKGFQVLTSASGTYTPTSGATNAIAIAVGGGGGGGGVAPGSGGSEVAAGGGGGGGAAVARFTISGNVSYTVGAAGTAGSSGGGNGGAGGTTTLTGIVVATGGSGGTGSGAAAGDEVSTPGGAGGAGSTGALLLGGGSGANGLCGNDTASGGNGGAAPFGGAGGRGGHGALGGGTQTACLAGGNYGGGGGGAGVTAGTGTAGAAGAQGVIYIFEFQ